MNIEIPKVENIIDGVLQPHQDELEKRLRFKHLIAEDKSKVDKLMRSVDEDDLDAPLMMVRA